LSIKECADSAFIKMLKPTKKTDADYANFALSVKKILETDGPVNLEYVKKEKKAKKLLASFREQVDEDKFRLLVKWHFQRIGASEVLISVESDAFNKCVVAKFDALRLICCVRTVVSGSFEENTGKDDIDDPSIVSDVLDMVEEHFAFPYEITCFLG